MSRLDSDFLMKIDARGLSKLAWGAVKEICRPDSDEPGHFIQTRMNEATEMAENRPSDDSNSTVELWGRAKQIRNAYGYCLELLLDHEMYELLGKYL